jgi:allantoinase
LGLKWIDYRDVSRETKREHLRQAVALREGITGAASLGFYLGRCSTNTLDLVIEYGGLTLR